MFNEALGFEVTKALPYSPSEQSLVELAKGMRDEGLVGPNLSNEKLLDALRNIDWNSMEYTQDGLQRAVAERLAPRSLGQ